MIQAQLVLQSAQLPMFPQIARTANMAGQVEASLTVDADGNVTSVEILSGPQLLGHRNREIYSLLEILRPRGPVTGAVERPFDLCL